MDEQYTEKVLPVCLEDEMQTSYIDYAMSVIITRALPDVRDGLKPVHRRILYAMHEAGMTPNKPYKKSARIVGEVLGKYHPHGDISVYDATVRLAQNFSTRYPLVDGHGNFGSVDGDSAAAMRYTEVRMAKITGEMLEDIDKETVDFMPNYDGSLQEPAVLPSKIPNLLVNGSAGIAVGMATNIPPHNLGEVVDGCVTLIDNPEATLEDIMKCIQGPDFPTGAKILGREGILKAYTTGRGSIKMRSCATIESMNKGKNRIVVTEIPYQVNKARVIESIADLTRNKLIDGITALRDESDRKGMRIVIELRADVNPDIVLNKLYKHTQLQETFGVIMLALVDGHPRVLTLKQVLNYYLDHQKQVITRRSQFELNKALARAHILEGLLIALDHIDEVIRMIRESANDDVAKSSLMQSFGLSEKQAIAILDMRLRRLTGLEREKIEEEYKELEERIAYLRAVLADEHKVMEIVKQELLEAKKRFSDIRRTQLVADSSELGVEDMIPDERMVLTLTRRGYVKRMNANVYHTQNKGGRGVRGMGTKEEDTVNHLLYTSSLHTVLFFTNLGRVYRLKAYEIPEANNRNSKGIAAINILPLDEGEKVNALIDLDQADLSMHLFMATEQGLVKKTPLIEFKNVRRNGLIAISLVEGDHLAKVRLTKGDQRIILATKQGMAICFNENDVRPTGRNTRGVRGISLAPDDLVIGADVLALECQVLTVSEEGFGKRNNMDAYNIQRRGGKGVKNFKITQKTGAIVGVEVVREEQELMLITTNGIVIRTDIESIGVKKGRNTSGVKIQKLEENDKVAALDTITVEGE
ncbi:DNA gyrase subunit A [Veillonellaceae bacterium M2-8]|uniref:DNA gyrase subunit A n=1 Tax=uncultured Megasphaera sp. TaxID=165188 RepID=UPI002598D95A|nr:DNA gyrase subunit A [uncultured Megasphaera sp.]MUP48127.1 DNA gyrase subunit A [Veillonellaceae bacterium M2-8]MUP58845.1 DNA gyrase subunit A [Veillonellaceae bacterium M2-4]